MSKMIKFSKNLTVLSLFNKDKDAAFRITTAEPVHLKLWNIKL